VLSANGLSINTSYPNPYLLYTAQPTWWQNGIVERPTLSTYVGDPTLFFAGAAPNTGARAIGWTTCTHRSGS
jgi:hypothetical protein